MSNRQNFRRGDTKDMDRTEHGSRWEGDDNSKCASRAWTKKKRRISRALRRNRDPRKTNAIEGVRRPPSLVL